MNAGSKASAGASAGKLTFEYTSEQCYCTCFHLFPFSRFALGRSFPGRGVDGAADGHGVVLSLLQSTQQSAQAPQRTREALKWD